MVAVQSTSTLVSPSQMAAALRRAGFPILQIPIMVAIGLAESGDPNHPGFSRVTVVSKPNKNGTVDSGVWQINSVHGFNQATLLTLDGNAAAAKTVYDRQGLGAWSTYNSGAYRPFLTAGTAGASSPDATAAPSTGVQNLGVPNPLNAYDWLKQVGSVITSGDFWKRAGIILLGAGLIILAAYMYTREQVTSVISNIKPTGGGSS